MAALRFLHLLLFTAGAIAGPLSPWDSQSNTCATRCPENTKFFYEPGKTYDYQYESDLKTWVNGASEDHSSLHMRATAQIEVISQCEMVMKLFDVSLQDSNPQDYESRQYVERAWQFTTAMQEKPLRFAFLDGEIENVCPDDEAAWVVNVKRGILSALQNTMPTLDRNFADRETDVSGNCPVEYEVSQEGWGSSKVTKTKDLMGCTERHGHVTAFQSSPYRVDSDVQSLPLMKSTHRCEQQVNSKGLLAESSCSEEHVFRPFSSGSSGAMTEVYYKIRLIKESPGITFRKDMIRERSTLIFDHTPTPEQLEENYREALKTLGQICRETRRDIRPEVPHLFSQLVRQMKLMDSSTLGMLARQASQGQPCSNAEKFIRDAVPILGTAASVEMIRNQIRDMMQRPEQEIDFSLIDSWVTNMAFYPTITSQMLAEAKPMLDLQPVRSNVVLAVSTMAHSYCRLNPDCNVDGTVQEIARILEQRLQYNCRAGSVEDYDTILMSLKALGNMGHTPQILPTLVRCVKTEDIPMELRISALQAFRRMGCTAERNELMGLYTNQAADAELRINAYMAVTQCMTPEILNTVRQTLSSEEVNQVGSFVWTHLTNLMETSNPHKQDIRNILEDVELSKEFNLDKRKFSRNVEWSAFSDGLNAGAMAEANLIWATDSYVPRSANLNLTIDLFGASVNLFEVGGRMEGFESLLEKLFGEDREINEVLGREKRDVIDKRLLDRLDTAFGKEPKTPRATYYVRIFGNELRYGDLHGLDLDTLKEKLNYLDWLIELAKEHSFDKTYSTMFLDTTLNIPTCVGMPLKLSVDGTATVNMKVTGKMDIRQVFTSPASMDVTGTISPSGAVEVNSEMEVDAFVARTGLRMTTTLHTSTSTDGSIKLQDGRVFNFELNTPQDKMEVLSAESKFYVVYRDNEREQSMAGERVEKQDCIRGKLTKALGLEACGEISFPKATGSTPWFPFTGPARASLVLNKKDTFSKYEFEAKYVKTKTNNGGGEKEIEDLVRVAFNTPGSRIDRELTAEFTMNRFKAASLNIRTPWKRATVDGELVNTAGQKKVEVRATVDGNLEYSALAEVLIEQKTATFYTPNVQIVMPRRDPITLGGRIQYREGKRLDLNLKLENLLRSPLDFEGEYLIDNKRGRTSGEITVSSGILDGKVTGLITRTDGTNAVSMTSEYSYNHGPQRRLSFNTKLRDKSTDGKKELGFNAGWESSFFPKYNGDVDADLSVDDGATSLSLDAGFDDTRRIRFSKASTYSLTGPRKSVESNVNFEFPYKNWKYEMDLSHMHSRNEVKSTVNVKKPVTSLFDMHLLRESTSPLKMSADVKLQYPGREMSWTETVQETEPKVYDHNLNIQLQKYQTITVTSVYRMVPRHEISTQINIPDMEPITISGHLNPSLTDMQAGGELTFNRQTYLAGTNWEVKGNTKVFDSNGALEIRLPGRHHKIESTLSRKYMKFTGNMELLMDATMNPERKVTVNSELKLKVDTPEVILEVAWPGEFFKLDASGGFETDGWYSSKKDVHGKIIWKSSFPGIQNIQTSFKHDWSKEGIETNGEVSWASNRKLTGDFTLKKLRGWSSVETMLDITTPYNNWRVVKATSTYSLAENSLDTSSTFQWDNQQMTLGLKGEIDMRKHLLDGEIQFTSPFRGFEDLSLTGRHTDNGRKFNSNLEASWGRGKSITGRFTMMHQLRGWFLTNSGEVTVTTPFPDARQMGLTWQHSHTDSQLNSHYELQYNGRKSIYDMEATHSTTSGIRSISGKAIVNSPYTGTRSLEISHSNEMSSWKNIQCSVTANWDPRTKVTYTHQVSVTPKMLSADAKFTSPFYGYRNIDLDLMIQKSANAYSTKNELKWDGNNKISLIGSVTVTGFEVQSNVRFTTPFSPVERIVVNVNNRRQGDLWASNADVEFAANKKIEIGTQFGILRQKRLAVDIKTPFQQLRSFSMDNTVRGTWRDFRLDSEVDYDVIGKNTLSINFDTANVDDIKTKLNFRSSSPTFCLSFIKAIFSHKRQGARYNTDATFSIPQYSGSASHDMTMRSATDFTTTTAVEYLPRQRVEVTTEFKMKPTVTGAVTFRSPFQDFEDISLTFNHKGELTNFESGAEIRYSPSHKLTANGEFFMTGPRITGSARLTTPYSRAERISMDFFHEGDDYRSFTNGGNFELNNMKYGAENEFGLRGTSMKASTKVRTPHQGFENVGIDVSHKGPLTNFNNEATVTYGRRTLTGTTEFSLTENAVAAKVTASSPYSALRNFEASFDHTYKKWSNFENSGSVMYNDQQYMGSSSMRWQRNNLKAESKVNIPEEYGLSLKHKGDLDDFNTKAEATVAGLPSTLSVGFKQDTSGVEGTANLATPYPGYENFEGSFSHKGGLKNFNTEAELQIPEKKFSGALSFKNKDSTEATVVVGTPFSNWQNTRAQFSHSASAKGFETTGDIQTSFPGYEQFKGTITHRGNPKNFQSDLQLESSVPGFEKILASLEHNGDVSAMNTDAKLETTISGYERFNFNLNHNGQDPTRVKSSVKLETPIQGMEKFGLNLEHNGDMRRFTTSARVNSPFQGYERFGIDVDHTRDIDGFQSVGKLSTPFPTLRAATVTMNHRGNLRDFNSGGSVEYNGKKLEGSVNFKQSHPDWMNADCEGGFRFNSPYSMMRSIEITAANGRSSAKKTGSMQLMYNGEKKADIDYEYTVRGRRDIRFTVREPHPMEAKVSYEVGSGTLSADADLNWNTRQRGSTIRFDTNVKNVVDAYSTDRSVTFRTTLPARTIGISTGYTKMAGKLTHSAEFQWNRQERNKIGYDFEVSKNSRRSQDIYDGKFTLNSASLPFEMTFNHKSITGRQYITEVGLGAGQRIVVKNDLSINSPSFTHQLTIQHPRFSRDVVISTEGTASRNLLSGNIDIAYERETFSFVGKLADDSTAGNMKMSGTMALKHPSSMLDFEWNGELLNNRQLMSGNMEAKYKMTKTRQNKIMSLRAEIKKLQQELDFQLVTPVKEVSVSGRKLSDDKYTGEIKTKGKTISGDLSIDRFERKADVTINTSPYDAMTVSVQYLGERRVSVEVARRDDGTIVKDLGISLDLLSDSMISGRSFVRPGVYQDLKEWYRDIDLLTPIRKSWQKVSPVLAEEFQYKKTYLGRALRPLQDAASSVAADVSAQKEDLDEIWDGMYARNDFHVQDMYKTAKRTYRQMSYNMRRYARRLEKATAEIQAQLDTWKQAAKTKYDALYAQYAPIAQQHFQELKNVMMTKYAEYRPHLDNLGDDIKSNFMDTVDKVRTHPKVQAWIERLTSMTPEEYLLALRDWSPKSSLWNAVKDWPVMQPVTTWAKEMYGKIESVYETHLKDIVDGLYAGGMQYLKDTVYDKANEQLHLDQDKWTVWDPQRGEYAFQLYVPTRPMQMLKKLPDLPELNVDIRGWLVSMKNRVGSWLPDDDWYLHDLYYLYKPSGDYFNWIPPFKGRATLAGGQHYMTFDKRFFEYTGECSYLLARDFLEGEFSVIVNYERIRDLPTKKSITVVSKTHQFEIFPSAKVVMDDRDVLEMPVQMEETTIVRTAHEIRVDNIHGITVICNLEYDRCTVNVTGWYFDRTGGLLGTYNNEPADDFTTPGGHRARNEAELADSWTVGKRCNQNNYATDVDVSPDNQHYKLCAQYFKQEDSPFRPCYRIVDPEPFMRMCLNDMPNNVNSIASEEDMCRMAHFYVSECKAEGVPLALPNVCVRCDLHEDKHFIQGENVTLNNGEAPSAADIVFVVQHHKCTQDPVNQLQEIADKIYKAYKSASIKDVEFSVVGFGGQGVESAPRVHTMEGRLFNSRDKMSRVVDSFSSTSGDHVDVMEAIHYAAMLPFRAGVAKAIVLIACDIDSCEERLINYLDLQDVLIERDIRLHYILEHEFVSKKGKGVSIFGVDGENAYTKKDAKKIKGNSKLRENMPMPKNLCAVLAEETDGSIFDIQKWRDVKPALGDKFEDTFTNLVAHKGTPTQCQECECVPDETGVGMAICRDCSFNEANLWNGSSMYVINSDDDVVEEKKFPSPPKTKKGKKGKGKNKGK